MRILYLADIRFPLERANGIQTFETCCALAGRGHHVTLAVRADTHVPPRDPFAFYGHDAKRDLAIARLPRTPAVLRRPAYVAWATALSMRSGAWDAILTRDLAVAATILRLPRALRPSLAYESHGYAPAVSEALPQLLGGALAPSPRKLDRLARRERRVWRRADAYVVITRALGEELTARFGTRPLLATIPDGVRLPDAAPGPPGPPPPRERPLVAYAGHLYPWKGVDVLLEAATHLPGIDVLVVGGHPAERDLPRVRALADRLGIASRVTFTGLVSPTEVAGHLARANLLVLPNTGTGISQRYTSPLKLFEYMASARPMVVSDLPALREVVQHGEHAWLVPPGDAVALATGIRRVLEDPGLARGLGERAWATVPRYSWSERARHIEQVLEQARHA